MSELGDLINRLPMGTTVRFTGDKRKAISIANKDETFVRPILKIENSVDTPNLPIVVISAPGAVGKSALANFIAAEKGCHIWDLSKLALGTNTFIGTLVEAFNRKDFAQLQTELEDGKVSFVLDAFDEAEIVSGWGRVEEFLEELFGLVSNAPCHTLVLFARSTTAQWMNIFLTDLAKKEGRLPCHVTYSIDYFIESQAKEFIEKQLIKLGKSAPKDHNAVFQQAINTIFSLFYKVVNASGGNNPWRNDEVRTFLGYAPVLQAITRYMSESDNYININNALDGRDHSPDGISLVANLMNDLLEREQKKLVKQLQSADIPEARGWNGWNAIYTPIEQLQRIFLRLQPDRQQQARATRVEEGIVPSWLVSTYIDALNSFMEQHPFIVDDSQNSPKFTGPAFKDYTFARLLAEQQLYEEVKAAWNTVRTSDKAYISSPLFALLYLNITKGEATGDLVGYLYDSAISRQGFQAQPRLIIFPREDYEGDTVHWFQILTDGKEMNEQSEIDLQFKFNVDDNMPVTFLRHIIRAYIEVKGKVVLGLSAAEFELQDVELICNYFLIRSNILTIRNYPPEERVYIDSKNYEQEPAILVINNNNPEKVKISWPNGKRHPWSDFYSPSTEDLPTDFKEAILALRRILSFFRKDRRVEFARYKQLVDNVVVGKRLIRRQFRDYLIHKRIITHREPLYYLDMKALEKAGVNFESSRQANMSDFLKEFIDDFLSWKQTQ